MDGILGEVRAFAFGFVPRGWMACNGQLLPISQYSALFSILGTYYGGNGQTNFQLPNLQGNVVVGAGQLDGNGTTYVTGETGGSASVSLLTTEMPAHNHTFNGATVPGFANNTTTPSSTSYLGNIGSKPSATGTFSPGRGYLPNGGGPLVQLNPQTIGVAGNSQPHNNMMPYVAVTYCICTDGIFPARN